MEIGYKFFVSDDLKEQANIHYNKGEYHEAITTINKALSFFRWLECDPDPFFETLNDINKEVNKDK